MSSKWTSCWGSIRRQWWHPEYLRVADGNEADCIGFAQVVQEYRHQWQFEGLLVADAALYTAENLKLLVGLKWISRVPLTLAEAQEIIRQVVPFAEWQGLAQGYRLIEVCTTYAEVAQLNTTLNSISI